MKVTVFRNQLRGLAKQPINSTAFYLFLATALSAVGGFLFWWIAARLTAAENVGIVSGLIASAALLKSFADLGFSAALVYYVGREPDNSETIINTLTTINLVTSLGVTGIYWLGIPLWAPGLVVLHTHLLLGLAFCGFSVIDALLGIQDAAMLIHGRPQYVFWRTVICNVPPFVLLLALVPFGIEGIFLAFALPNVIVALVTTGWYLPKQLPHYRLLRFDRQTFKQVWRFGVATQIANIFWGLPGSVLPIIVLNTQPAAQAGYFSINWTVVNFLLIAPRVMATSLFVEGSRQIERSRTITLNALRTLLAILLFPLIGFWFLGSAITGFFGSDYVNDAVIRSLLIGVIGFAVSSTFYVSLRIEKRLGNMIIYALIIAITVTGGAWVLAPILGVQGVAWGWSLGFSVGAVWAGIDLLLRPMKPNPTRVAEALPKPSVSDR